MRRPPTPKAGPQADLHVQRAVQVQARYNRESAPTRPTKRLPDTRGVAVGALETEVNAIKAILRANNLLLS